MRTDLVNLADRLQKLKTREAKLKDEKAKLQGRHDQLIDQLRNKFYVDNIEDAQVKLQGIQKDIRRREERAQRLLSELEEAVA